jgi:hypothetical protein
VTDTPTKQPGRVVVDFISHSNQRYDTVGDWYYDKGMLRIMVSYDHPDLQTETEQEAVVLHELIEAWLCHRAGVTQKQVDEFDFAWTDGHAEPGECKAAPYHRQHMAADLMERMYLHEATSYNRENSKES